MENEEVHTSIMGQFDMIASFDTQIFQKTRFSDYQYQSVESVIKIFQSLVEHLSEVDESLIIELPGYDGLISFFNRFQSVLEKILNHSKNKKSKPDNAKIFKQEIISCYKELLNNFSYLTVFLVTPTSNNYLTDIMDNYNETIEITNNFKLKQLQVEEILKNINQKAAEADVSRYSTKFQQSSREYQVSSKLWLSASGFFLILTLVIVSFYNTIFTMSAQAETVELIKYLSTKILILTLLISATLWCAKLYKVDKNLSVVYEHKSNSLDTFTEFVNSAQSLEIKDFVLQETTKTIFNLPETGLIGSDNLPVQSLSKVIDLAKSTVGKS